MMVDINSVIVVAVDVVLRTAFAHVKRTLKHELRNSIYIVCGAPPPSLHPSAPFLFSSSFLPTRYCVGLGKSFWFGLVVAVWHVFLCLFFSTYTHRHRHTISFIRYFTTLHVSAEWRYPDDLAAHTPNMPIESPIPLNIIIAQAMCV